ncbi:MAG TPA: response regulator transcription factor [Gemmatimonadales bacterium]|jgi:DNA-binding response OmpR family regulator|nr:response regulator transcription factor [Gemmatimonadales bacterium]
MSRILLIEDNRGYAATLCANLEREGYQVSVATTGLAGLEAARSEAPDLVILDLMLPGMNGFSVLQRLRDEGRETPLLIMTALGTEEEKLRGFGLGADDYIVKPCGLLEILARVRALLKRAGVGGGDRPLPVRVGDLAIDFATREVRRGDRLLALRPKEFDLLAALVRRRGAVVSRDTLLREVWGYAAGTESRTVETHLAALRQRLGDDPRSPRYIATVRGAGYRLLTSF